MTRFTAGIVLAALVLAPAGVLAAAFDIDPVHSSITFKVRHVFSKVKGEFTDFSGSVRFDPEKPTQATAEATIQVASIDTNNERRDGHLRSPDFFDAETHPEITFKSTKIEQTDEGLKITGDLTMRGITKPVTLTGEFLGSGAHPMMEGATIAGFTASGKLNRKDWDIKWNKVLDTGGAMLGDTVELLIEVEAVHSDKGAE